MNDFTTVKNSPMTLFLKIKIKLVKRDNYVMIQVFVLHENILAKWQRRENEGKK